MYLSAICIIELLPNAPTLPRPPPPSSHSKTWTSTLQNVIDVLAEVVDAMIISQRGVVIRHSILGNQHRWVAIGIFNVVQQVAQTPRHYTQPYRSRSANKHPCHQQCIACYTITHIHFKTLLGKI